MKKSLISVCILASALTAFSVCAKNLDAPGVGKGAAHGKGMGKVKEKGQGVGRADIGKRSHGKRIKSDKLAKAKFRADSRTLVTKYFHAKPFPVSTLPPGIAMNLARGKPLPPGIQKVFLPSGLTRQLPYYPGYEYLVVGNDVVLVDRTSLIVADILTDVL